jgi:riboflavin synthase
MGRVEEIVPSGEHRRVRVSFDSSFSVFVVEKGSLAVDGISLTVNRCGEGFAEFNVIPHTFETTNLKYRRRGDWVNLEFDLFGKYAVNYLRRLRFKEELLKGFLNF